MSHIAQHIDQALLIGKLETTYGTDATPTAAANAIRALNVKITPLAGGTTERPPMGASMGAKPKLHINKHVLIEFDVELIGSGDIGTAPAWFTLDRASGMQHVSESFTEAADTDEISGDINDDTDTGDTVALFTLLPTSNITESLSLYFYQNDTIHKILGARGGWSQKFSGSPLRHYSFVGLYTQPTAGTIPASIDYSAFDTKPVQMTKENTPIMQLGGYDLVTSSFDINSGITPKFRDLVNAAGVRISDRSISGSLTIEKPAIGDKNFFALAESETPVAFRMQHGTETGNIIDIAADNVQILQPNYAEEDKITMLTMQLLFLPSGSGDNEIKFIAR